MLPDQRNETASRKKKCRKRKYRLHSPVTPYLFLLPNITGVFMFVLFPVLFGFGVSFCKWDLVTSPKFIGLSNYLKLLEDPVFLKVLFNTVYFVCATVSLSIICALGLAIALNQKLKGSLTFRAIYFLPVLASWVAIAIVWRWMFNPNFGIINYLLGKLGIEGPRWLASLKWAMPAIIILSVWRDSAFFMVIFLAGLQSIPSSLYETADLDGANRLQKFAFITLPLSTPTIFFVVIIATIVDFQVFTQISVMTRGGPFDATRTLVYYVYENAFRWLTMGYAASMSGVLFSILFIITLLQWKLRKRWVFGE